jgi:hypothetical protein
VDGLLAQAEYIMNNPDEFLAQESDDSGVAGVPAADAILA